MKTAVAQVYEILNESTLFKDVDIYSNAIPEVALTSPQLPLARIVELQGAYTNSASNNPHAIVFYIQLDIWVKSLKDVDTYYFPTDELMRANSWECIYTEQANDPDLKDTKRIIKRYTATINLDIQL